MTFTISGWLPVLIIFAVTIVSIIRSMPCGQLCSRHSSDASGRTDAGKALADVSDASGPRQAAVARVLTKRFEEVRRGILPELAAHYRDQTARGEVTVVVGLAEQDDPEDLDGKLSAALAGNSVKDAAALDNIGIACQRDIKWTHRTFRGGRRCSRSSPVTL